MNTLPKDYVILGHIKDINVPKSWETNSNQNYTFEEHLSNWAYHYSDGNWRALPCDSGWMPKSGNYIIAALIGSPLYNMNLKKTRPTVKQVKELNNKILSLEATNGCMEVEIKKLREQLAAIGKIIKGE